MSLNLVTLILDLADGTGNPRAGGAASLVPSAQLTDTTDNLLIDQAPIQVPFMGGGSPQVKLLATDDGNLAPSGWAWTVSFTGVPGNPASFTFFLPYASGATQYLSSLSPVSDVTTMAAYLPIQYTNGAASGYVWTSDAYGNGSWQANSGGGGGLSNPMTTLGDLIYENATPAAARLAGDTSNTRKFLRTQASSGVAQAPAWDTLQSGDIPALSYDASGAAVTAQSNAESFATSAVATETSRAETAEALAAQRANNLSDLANAGTARTNLGLGSAATQSSSAFDASGAAATAQSTAETFATSAVATETSRAEAAEALKAPLASPALTGSPTAPTQTTGDNTTKIATDAFVTTAVATETTRAEAAEAACLPLAGGTVGGPLAVTGELTAAGFELPLMSNSRRLPYRPATWAQLFQSGHGWTASGAGVGSSNLNDTSTFIKGTQCATVTTAGNGSQAALSLLGGTAQNLTGKMIRLTFQVANITHLSSIGFYVGTSSLGSNFLWNVFTSTPSYLNYVQSGEWVTVCISWADLYGAAGYTISSAGAPSTKTGFTDMRLAVYDDGAGAVTIHYQSVEIVPDTSVTFPNGLVSITFDDSFQNVYDNARPVMDTYGYAGSLCTIVDQIGPGRLTLPELRSIQTFSGWEVAGHAYTLAAHNAGYETLTADAVNTELRNLKAWLVSNGFPADTFAYPMGYFSPTTDGVPVDQLAGQYFPAARTIISELNATWPPPMPLRMFGLTGVSSYSGGVPVSTLTAANGTLVRCAQQGAWLQLNLHQIVTVSPTDTTQLLQSDFSTLMSFINSLGMAVLPVGTVTRFYS